MVTFLVFFSSRCRPKDPVTLSADWNFKGKSKTDDRGWDGGTSGRGVGGGWWWRWGFQAMRSLFRKTLEATGNSTLHFSCQTPADLMACSQRVVRQRDGAARAETWRECRSRRRPSTTLATTTPLQPPPTEKGRPPELLKLLNASEWANKYVPSFRAGDSGDCSRRLFKEENEIWSQLYSNCSESTDVPIVSSHSTSS